MADCTNKGEIGYAHIGYNVGGVIGRQSGTVINCKNMGHVMGRKDVGGIIGQAEPYRESEYLSDHLEKVRDDFSEINHLMGQMSDAMRSVSSDTRGYVQTLQQQYEDTMGNLDSEINSMKSTVTGNNAGLSPDWTWTEQTWEFVYSTETSATGDVSAAVWAGIALIGCGVLLAVVYATKKMHGETV